MNPYIYIYIHNSIFNTFGGFKLLIEFLPTIQIINNVLTANGSSRTTTGQMENIGEVKCPVSVNRRRKRSTTNETIQYYLVSVTNDGVTYSDSVPLILYDTSCYTCTTTDSNVNCQLRVCSYTYLICWKMFWLFGIDLYKQNITIRK